MSLIPLHCSWIRHICDRSRIPTGILVVMASLATRLSRPHRCNAYRALRYELIYQAFVLSLSLAQARVEAPFHTPSRCVSNRHLLLLFLLPFNEMRRLSRWSPLTLPTPEIITQTGNKQMDLFPSSWCMIHPRSSPRLQCAWKHSLAIRHQGEGPSITRQPTQSWVVHFLKPGGARRLVVRLRP